MDKGKIIKRPAVMRPAEIVAECPIDSTCSNRVDGAGAWQRCGWYEGTIRDRNGLRVECRYSEGR